MLATATSTGAPARDLTDWDDPGLFRGWQHVDFGESLRLRATISAMAIDRELPGHPTLPGRGHIGAVLDARLDWKLDPHFSVEAGVLARTPFSLEVEEELGALPIIALILKPLGNERIELRLGSLNLHHGFHPALADEDLYRFGRHYAENYHLSLRRGVERNLENALFLPAEHGVQLTSKWTQGGLHLHGDTFVDWQLVETKDHREKFAFGALAGIEHKYASLDLQMRLVHYGGELFTKRDPIRASGMDPVRQPTTYAAVARARPYYQEDFIFTLLAAYAAGKIAQSGGEPATWHYGAELGTELDIYQIARIGYRLWLPIDREYGFLSEDSDPVYSGRRSHRFTFALSTTHGPAKLSGHLDLLSADGAEKVQYEAATTLAFSFDPLLWSATAQPPDRSDR